MEFYDFEDTQNYQTRIQNVNILCFLEQPERINLLSKAKSPCGFRIHILSFGNTEQINLSMAFITEGCFFNGLKYFQQCLELCWM